MRSTRRTRSSADVTRAALLSCLLLALATPSRAQSGAPAAASTPAASPAAGTATQADADLVQAVTRLSALDYSTRMNAGRTLRRANAPDAVRLLTAAVRESSDQFVRYRALVLLTGFGDRSLGTLMRSLIEDRNDRVREVAYTLMAAHPDREMTFPLLAALEREQAEFVRPALVRALAMLGSDPAVQRALVNELGRGLDFFRIAVIEALGAARATYARPALAKIAEIDGPLQDDAVLALGRIGDPRDVPVLTALTLDGPDARMARHAALCLLGDACAEHVTAIRDALTAPRGAQDTMRPALLAASAVGEGAPDTGYGLLLDAVRRPATHDVAAIVLGGAALRRPDAMLTWLLARTSAEQADVTEAFQFAFSRLEDDLAQETFFASVRARYWQAADGSAERELMAALIQKLSY